MFNNVESIVNICSLTFVLLLGFKSIDSFFFLFPFTFLNARFFFLSMFGRYVVANRIFQMMNAANPIRIFEFYANIVLLLHSNLCSFVALIGHPVRWQ